MASSAAELNIAAGGCVSELNPKHFYRFQVSRLCSSTSDYASPMVACVLAAPAEDGKRDPER